MQRVVQSLSEQKAHVVKIAVGKIAIPERNGQVRIYAGINFNAVNVKGVVPLECIRGLRNITLQQKDRCSGANYLAIDERLTSHVLPSEGR